MLLFSFPARSFKQLDNLNALIADWGHTTEDWVEYMLTWSDRILDYEVQGQRGPEFLRAWHGQQWKIPKSYEEQSEDLALIIGDKGQAILDVSGMMEKWVKRKPNTKYPSSLKIKRMFQKAKHLAFLLKGKINKEWQRLESERPVEPQPTAKKIKSRTLDTTTQDMFKLMAQLKAERRTRKECFKSFHKTYPKMTYPKFLLLIRQHNRHIQRTSSGQ